ncbi:uncharacterized protein LOC105220119 [Zeugodacus cucurbitae]|uniref:uncharacterized protein LOC105220119 n=1 Tax=Zeugodacus cucurbitae TaxID=28588 RepID=UPI0023D95335|nr:uncharacterized protein LOC105220119 [Zeugodacus cucurbitae]
MNCMGALDGKHINIIKPDRSGSEYYNYKGHCSIVLMALADANYCFTYVTIGAKGSGSNGGVFNECKFYEKLQNNQLNIPPNRPLLNIEKEIPFVIVADDAMMPERIFNYRLSRARRIIENAFGIASARFRCLRTTMNFSPQKLQA